jgi:uncharacterized protein YceK
MTWFEDYFGKAIAAGVFLCMTNLTSGCIGLVGTYMQECFTPHCNDWKIEEYYPAVRFDLRGFEMLSKKEGIFPHVLMYPVLVVDLPISFAVDTVFLPIKAIVNLSGNPEPPSASKPEKNSRPDRLPDQKGE